MRAASESIDQGRPAPARDVPLSLAEAVVACLALRDIPRLRAHYPTAMRAEDAAELRAALSAHLRSALADSRFDDLRARPGELNLDTPATDEDLTSLLFALLLRVPGVLPTEPNREIAPDAMRKAVAACQDRIGPSLQALADQLGEIKLYDCRIPGGDPTFADPRRSLQMVRLYWAVCRSIVVHQIDAPIGYQPHPLQRIIMSLRARIGDHLLRLEDGDDRQAASEAMDALMDTVLGGEPDDLSAAPEWARRRLQTIEGFLEATRLRAGSKAFPLTHEEEVFLQHAETEVGAYHRHVGEAWARMLATAGPPTTQARSGGPAQTTSAPAASSSRTDAAAPAGAAAGVVRADLAPGSSTAAGQGQPCLGLSPSAVRVLRAYKEWEARRAKRRGLPAIPTVDDLVEEAQLARATVVEARKGLLRDGFLEQVQGARAGVMRLSQRGLALQFSAHDSSVQSSVQ